MDQRKRKEACIIEGTMQGMHHQGWATAIRTAPQGRWIPFAGAEGTLAFNPSLHIIHPQKSIYTEPGLSKRMEFRAPGKGFFTEGLERTWVKET